MQLQGVVIASGVISALTGYSERGPLLETHLSRSDLCVVQLEWSKVIRPCKMKLRLVEGSL